MSHALVIDDVSKRYTEHVAVNHLSLSVPTGTIYGILGPNGAGKSSTLRMVMNILSRDGGTITLLGADPAKTPAVLKRVGYLPEERGLYKKMKVIDVIVFFAALKGVAEKAAQRDGTQWLDKMGLSQWKDSKVETLSKGMQQKVQFITTVIHQPELLILDEPASESRSCESGSASRHDPWRQVGGKDRRAEHAQHGSGRGAVRLRMHHRRR
ncbi:MAG: ABC transporter ATP-binding protein [Gemmatimonadaceae bacterium]